MGGKEEREWASKSRKIAKGGTEKLKGEECPEPALSAVALRPISSVAQLLGGTIKEEVEKKKVEGRERTRKKSGKGEEKRKRGGRFELL